MTMIYAPSEMKVLNLVECSDGHYRTTEMRDAFDAGALEEVWCGVRHVFVEQPKAGHPWPGEDKV